MILAHPNPHPSFDLIPEKTGQYLIHQHCPSAIREFGYEGYPVDIKTQYHLLEIKRSSNSSGINSAKPHHPLGQILYYQSCHKLIYGEELIPGIIIYGTQIHRYLTRSFQYCRGRFGVKLWVVESFRDGTLIDCDTGEVQMIRDL